MIFFSCGFQIVPNCNPCHYLQQLRQLLLLIIFLGCTKFFIIANKTDIVKTKSNEKGNL